ncbi:MAG: Class aldolase/adducin family protein [Variovorax sp.]|jgi:ribulose-5-phosphate 4-epimerase/fuculose-1-phosphate aldolase|nr:Class aldolase/adducin family protein [Variovorax sp.]
MPLYMKNDSRDGDKAIAATEAEHNARIELAECYRILHMLGWTELIFNHVTLRVPGPERVFLINPFGLNYDEVTADNLVAVDIDGLPVRPGQAPINRAGFVTHSAIHRHVEGAHCVMHTHTTTGCAVSCLEEGLSHDSFYGAQLFGRVAYHDFEGVTVNMDEQARMVQSIGNSKAVILRNHGLLALGSGVQEAFMWLWLMQRACDIQIAAASAGRIRSLSTQVRQQTSDEAAGLEPALIDLVYASLRRKLGDLSKRGDTRSAS